ncbi:Glutathione peroxidase [Rhynchospora pubera]|uniref:Glutathione peroxidase n=2 Tax=Rhynchospora pubera TaxID=906938 RepID=A0AAV8CG46_9POAL|nr:Glutathione peroxidase [Rhynchospora pubera]
MPSASPLSLFHSFLSFAAQNLLWTTRNLLYKPPSALLLSIFPIESKIVLIQNRTPPSLMASLSTSFSPSSAALHEFAMGRRPLAQVLHVAGKSPSGSATFRVVSQNFASQFPRDPFHWSKRMRSAGMAYASSTAEKTIYEYTVKDIDGKNVPLNKFKGKVMLIVNVASRCGLTTSNYTELSHIYEKYKTQGFEILAFPCNQFGAQEPGSNSDIKQFACTRFKAEFPIFDKVDVNGPTTAPVYQYLKSHAGGFLGDLIKWNFEKFLVDKNGKVVERYPPTTSPFQIEKDIKKLLAA